VVWRSIQAPPVGPGGAWPPNGFWRILGQNSRLQQQWTWGGLQKMPVHDRAKRQYPYITLYVYHSIPSIAEWDPRRHLSSNCMTHLHAILVWCSYRTRMRAHGKPRSVLCSNRTRIAIGISDVENTYHAYSIFYSLFIQTIVTVCQGIRVCIIKKTFPLLLDL